MKQLSLGLLLMTGLAFAAQASVDVGDKMPEVEMEIVHPLVDSFDDFQGRAVLVEFFAHW